MLREALLRRSSAFAGAEIRQVDDSGERFVVLIPASSVGKRSSKRLISHRALRSIAEECKRDLCARVEWIVTGGESATQLHQAFADAVRSRFPDLVEDVVVSDLTRSPVIVWIEVRGTMSHPSILRLLEKVASELLSLLGGPKAEIVIGGTRNLPSKAILLRSIKAAAPASSGQVLAALVRSEFESDAEWLSSRLDSLRRQGLVVRSRAGLISLSEKGVRLVPHGDFHSSSDIERVLALARRRW